MARIFVVGGGCRGRELAGELVQGGHAVRISTRGERGRPAIEATGAECWIGDPDVIGTLRYGLDRVAVLVWALATARGEPEDVAALHGDRLQMMLSNVIDSTVRGVVYEAVGSVDPAVLRAGAERVRTLAQRSQIPHALLEADPADAAAWTGAARAAVELLLTGG